MTENKTGASKVIHPWSSDALFAKAQRYAEGMRSYSPEEWQYGLLSTFVLEFLARAALAKISPALLGDPNDWNNIYYALGGAPKAPKFIPRSVDVYSVMKHLREINPEFTPEQEGFSAQHMARRNEELHTGGTPFDGADSAWLGPFYQSCETLLKSLGQDLSSLVGSEEAKTATAIIAAFQDESAKAVKKTLAAHKTVWEASSDAERETASRQASTWATRQKGHRVRCPSCGSDALLVGNPISEAHLEIEEDLIVETQQYLPAKFECVACRLKIAGLSQLSACGLGAPYKSTSTYDAVEYYADQYAAGFEDDNNEY